MQDRLRHFRWLLALGSPWFLALGLPWFLAGLSLCACAGGPDAEPLEVIARLGQAGAPTQPAQPVAPLKLGTETRRAVRVAGDSSFEVEVPGTREIAFGIGIAEPGDGPGRFEFAVHAEARGTWRPVFSAILDADTAGWREGSVDAAALPAGTHRFRFETRSLGADGQGTPSWGSVVFRGSRGGGSRPNVILLSLDTLGAGHLSSFDNPADVSPRIDAFLDAGFSFRRAYAQFGNTYVSHSSLFSAQYPVHHRRYGQGAAPLMSLVGELAAAGYRTAAFTENAFVSSTLGFAAGFDRYDDGDAGPESTYGDASDTFARAGDWLGAAGAGGPFFLFVHTYEVHGPFLLRDEASRQVASRLAPGDPREWSGPELTNLMTQHNLGRRLLGSRALRRMQALHSGEIHFLDRVVGRFLDQLAALGLAEDTILVLTADHGAQFGEHGKVGHGHSLHNRVLHVPLGFRWPGRIRTGSSDAPVQLVDVMPSVLDLVGLPPRPGVDGRSLAPILLGEQPVPPSRPAFAELGRGVYAVQTERFKLVASPRPQPDRLYDLVHDPLEQRDVAAAFPEEVARHRALLATYLGPVEAPVAPPAESFELPLDAETRRRLQALGYLE